MRDEKIRQWAAPDVTQWLHSVGLGVYAPLFTTHRLTGIDLLDLTNDDLRSIGILVLHDRKRILRAAATLTGER